MSNNILTPPSQPKEADSEKKKKHRWYQRPEGYDDVAWETRKLVVVTVALGFFTLLAVGGTIAVVLVGFRQIGISEKSFKDQSVTNGKMIDRMDSQIEDSRKFAVQQDTFSRATLDSTGIQISTAKETMQKGLRAYVEITPRGDSDQNYMDLYIIRNDGHTPAYDLMEWNCTKVISTKPLPNLKTLDILPASGQKEAAKTTLNPGANAFFLGRPYAPTPDEQRRMSHDSAAVFEYGMILYRDIFGVHHRVRFTFQFSTNGNPYECGASTDRNDGN